MELTLILLGTAALTAALVFGVVMAMRRASLDVMDHLILDEGGRYVHVFGQTTHMPEDQDSFSIYHHLLIDLDTLAVYAGDHRRGEDLELDSPFVAGSIAALSRSLGVPLALGRKRGEEVEKGPRIHVRDARKTDTETAKPLPPNGVVLWTVSDTPPRFDLELRRDGKTQLRKPMKGHVDGPFRKRCAVPARDLLLMTYLRDVNLTTGVALLVIDTKASTIRSDEWLRIGGPTAPLPPTPTHPA